MKKQKNISEYKKGNVFIETILILVVIFAFAIISIFSVKFYNEIEPALELTPDLSNDSINVLQGIKNYLPDLMNNAFLILMIFLWLATIFLSFTIDVHPAFFVIALVLLVITLLVGMMLGNTYSDIASSEELSEMTSDFSYAYWVFSHIHIVTLIIGASLLISIYAKNKYLGGGSL